MTFDSCLKVILFVNQKFVLLLKQHVRYRRPRMQDTPTLPASAVHPVIFCILFPRSAIFTKLKHFLSALVR